jgi:hypothetical protein
MNVRPLDAQMDDPESLAQRCGDRGIAHGLVQFPSPHIADLPHHAHDDMQRMIRLDRLAPGMGRASPRLPGLAPGSVPLPAMPKQLLLHMPLPRPPRPRRLHVARDNQFSVQRQVENAYLIIISFIKLLGIMLQIIVSLQRPPGLSFSE